MKAMTAPVVLERASEAGSVADRGRSGSSTDTNATGPFNALNPAARADLAGLSAPGEDVAAAEPSAANRSEASDVGSVVSKAKRAASSLWLLLHAQNCRLGGGRCPHSGCNDAKLIQLHLKTCPAGSGFGCPQNFNGCNQSRKLLAHYRRCRETRTKIAGIHPSRRTPRTQQHTCLVCSLVARQARNVLDSGRATAPLATRKGSSANRKTMVIPNLQLGAPKEDMPPPPPRFSGPIMIHKAADANSWEPLLCESPPSTDDLMRREMTAVAALAAPCALEGADTSDSALLGKSVDSTKTSLTKADPETGSRNGVNHRRPRSESLDAASVGRFTSRATDFDPTLEGELVERIKDPSAKSSSGSIRRSSSMGMLVGAGNCETIVEENSLSLEDQQFLFDEETEG